MKTLKGRREVATRSMALSGRQRQVLIMVDGIKQMDDINKILPEREFVQIVQFLQQQELIVMNRVPDLAPQPDAPEPPRPAALTAAVPAAAPANSPLTDDPQHVASIKRLLLNTARAYLGILADDVQRRINQASDASQLLSVLGHWHMALRESRQGRVYVEHYFEAIKVSFQGQPVPRWPLLPVAE